MKDHSAPKPPERDPAMNSPALGPVSKVLTVTHSEAIALLSAYELSPFEDEVLEQKLLDIVYSAQRPDREHHSHGRGLVPER